MINYAEEIAYLYFRLNGFFLLDNYVTHVGENLNRCHSDSDLLGIKTNLVFEDIGLNKEDDIELELFELIKGYKFVGLICEVKGGRFENLDNTTNRIKPCVTRMGLLDRSEIAKAVATLKENTNYESSDKSTKIIKVIATNSMPNKNLSKSWKYISLDNMLSFIEERSKKYPQKGRGWNFYSSNLFQYLLKKNQA
jgi:hypothetical protein